MTSLQNQHTPQLCRWHSFESTGELERAALTEILQAAQTAINQRGAFHIVLAGGTSPRKVYEALKTAQTNWNAWHIYIGDERCLPADHPERNSLMATQAWLAHVAIPENQIHAIPTEQGASIAAEKYARIISNITQFDLVLLGLGEDGHTASLFPEHDAGSAADAPATLVITDSPKPPPQRVSLSARRLSAAQQVIFLVTGAGKLQAVKNWRTGVAIPASTISPAAGVDIFIEASLLNDA
jgi:6-phosphogluconolactonase